jgi:hypothetical protein
MLPPLLVFKCCVEIRLADSYALANGFQIRYLPVIRVPVVEKQVNSLTGYANRFCELVVSHFVLLFLFEDQRF